MLEEVKRLQDRAVSALVEEINKKREITFKAPTGSGKTHMMADFMNRILSQYDDVVFLVSSLSKSDLARQNYEKFCEYKDKGEFKRLDTHLISSEVSGEEALHIPLDHNVYILPRDLYKKGGRLMQGAMENFLGTVTRSLFSTDLNKRVYLIKDECHQATNNLDNISESYFSKVINISATPKLSRRQVPDVEITEEEALNAKLIKDVEWNESYESRVTDAIDKFKEIKDDYRNLLGVNPCLIIQISNKEKADDDLNEIQKALSKNQDLKWMLIVNEKKDCDTNDVLKAKRVPVERWKDYAKSNESTIDIIIFKLVITEGWDIPRACMLYQMRITQSKQLDEQVVGRVRRNPRLMDFERLSDKAQELAMKAWVWGKKEIPAKQIITATLFEEPSDITDNIKIRTTRLKPLNEKKDFSIQSYMSQCKDYNRYGSIFELYRKFRKADPEVRQMGYEYAEKGCQWMRFCENIDDIAKKNSEYICDYKRSMELSKDEATGEVREVSFPVTSIYTDNENYCNISDWVWRNGKDGEFAFDSDAEKRWAEVLREVAQDDTEEPNSQRVAMRVLVGKHNPKAGESRLDGSVEPEKIDTDKKYLWGKNYVSNSEIRYEYCKDGVHKSYPDFVLEDCFGRIHLFEVKSVNIANGTPADFDSEDYKAKINALTECYKHSSRLTGHIFYLPVRKEMKWYITKLENGMQDTLTLDTFKKFIKKRPATSVEVKTIADAMDKLMGEEEQSSEAADRID